MVAEREDLNGQLLALVKELSEAPDFQGALSTAIRHAGRLLPCDGTSVMWLDEDRLEVLASQGGSAPLRGLILPVNQVGAARALVDSSRPILVADTARDGRWQPVPGEERVRCWLGVPLVVEGHPVGLIEWTALGPESLGAEETARAAAIGLYAAPILFKAKLHDALRERLRELSASASGSYLSAPDLEARLQALVREAREFSGAHHSFLFLMEDGSARLRCVAAAGDRRDRLAKIVLRGDGTLSGWRMASGRPSGKWAAGPSDREQLSGLGIEGALLLPLRVGGQQVGMLGIAGPERGRGFAQDALRTLTYLASQAALLVEQGSRPLPPASRFDYEQVVQSSPLGVALLTVTGDIRVSNPALAGLLSAATRSLAGRTLSGRNLLEFLAPADGRRLRQALEEVAVGGQWRQLDLRIRSDQGEHRFMRFSLSLAQVADEAGGSLVAMLEDVTAVKILERERVEHLKELGQRHSQLKELDKLKSRFVSNVSHELRTPLAVIKLYATLARRGRPDKQSHYLRTIEHEIHRLETLVENVLDLTRLDRQALEVHPEWVQPGQLVSQVIDVYQETAKQREITLTCRIGEPLPTFYADRSHVIQMVTNLVDNALKYTPRGGRVWVDVAGERSNGETRLRVAVADTGSGIPEDEQKRVFERFYRGSNNASSSTGTGLGLAIVQELVALHGGSIAVESQLGSGSVFTLLFPLPGKLSSGSVQQGVLWQEEG